MEDLNAFRLDDRLILLTGAAGYLGTAIAESLCSGGAKLLLAGRTESTLVSLAARLNRQMGIQCAHPLVLDIEDEGSRNLAAEQIALEHKSLHGFVNNAYSGRVGPLATIDSSDFDSACAQNLSGPFHLIQMLLPMLTAAACELTGGASIVNIASMYGLVSPDPRVYGNRRTNNPIHYGATKAGMIQMTRYLACHLADRNIRVNSVSPGPCPKHKVAKDDPSFVEHLNEKTPLGRIGEAEEIAHPVRFLLSAAASYITGANLPVDGGWTAW